MSVAEDRRAAPGKVQRAIDTLQDRAEYLERRIEQDVAAGAAASFKRDEVWAIRMALPLLDAELRRQVEAWRRAHPDRPRQRWEPEP